MRDYAGLYRELMNADNRAFVGMLKEAQEREKQELEEKESWENFKFKNTPCDICDNTQHEAE